MRIVQEFWLSSVAPLKCADLSLSPYPSDFDRKGKKIWNCYVGFVCTISLDGNKSIFEDLEGSVNEVWDKVKFWSALRLCEVQFSDLVRHWQLFM